jgi:hypothetical protein
MENNPKKSKAFIITFILILLLLLAGYYLYSNRAKIFDAKGAFSLSKIFSPLLTNNKNGELKTTDNGEGGAGNKSNVVTTDQNGNKIVRAEAGEDIKKGDVLYISGFNKNKDPIVMKAIANDKKKSLVFGLASQDAKKGDMFDVIIEGILSGINTKRTEITLWAINNPLYLSDKTYGGMTKNTPKPPSYIVPVASIIKVGSIDGSIRIGGLDKNLNVKSVYVASLKAFNSQLLGYSDSALRDYWNIVYGGGISGSGSSNGNLINNNNTSWNNNGFIVTPITIPISESNNYNPGNYSGGVYSNIDIIAPSSVKYGETAIISWTSTSTTSCKVIGGNGTGISGSFTTGKLTKDTSFVISCVGENGTIAKTAYIYVIDDGSSTTPIVTVTAKPAFIAYGESTTISWTSSRDISCTVNGGTAIKGKNGSFVTPALTDSMSYNVTCTDANGSATTTNVYVTVTTNPDGKCLNNATNPPTCTTLNGACMNNANNPPLCTTTANICLNSATNPPSCTTINDICLNNSTNPPLCNDSIVTSNVCPLGWTGTYPNCVGPTTGGACPLGWTGTYPNCVGDTIPGPTVDPYVYPTFTPYPFVTITATPMLVESGAGSKISWESTNTTSCNAGAGNGTGTSGSFMTGPLTIGKSFAISCTGTNGTAGSDIFVGISGINMTFPVVSITASSLSVTSGGTTTISWSSINTTSCNAGAGNETGTSGSFTTTALTVSKSYVITCTGINGTSAGNIFIGVIPSINTTQITPIITTPVTVVSKGVCPADTALQFTDEEQKQLDVLSRKFYLLAPTIRTEDDVNLSATDATTQQNFLNQIKGLTKECYAQTGDTALYSNFCTLNPTYCNAAVTLPTCTPTSTGDCINSSFTGDKTRFGNPWYKNLNRGTYMPGYENFELMLNIW